jgi:hypothetical protein
MLFAGSRTAGASVGSDQLGTHSKGITRDVAGSVAVTKATLAVLRKRGGIRHLALQTEPTKPSVSQIEMHLFASRRSERHAQAWRITAGSIQAKHPPIHPISLLGKPASRSGSELSHSRKPCEYLVARTSTTRSPHLYFGSATHCRFASLKRPTGSGERSN